MKLTPDQPEPTLAELREWHLRRAYECDGLSVKWDNEGDPNGAADCAHDAAWHEAAARQLEGLAGQGWIEATNLPPSLEGTRAWRWLRWDGTMEIVHIPRGYNRRPSACGEVWFWPLPQPATPAEEPRALAGETSMPRQAPSLTVYGTIGTDDMLEAAQIAGRFGLEFHDRPAGRRYGCVYQTTRCCWLTWWTEARGLAVAKSERAGEEG